MTWIFGENQFLFKGFFLKNFTKIGRDFFLLKTYWNLGKICSLAKLLWWYFLPRSNSLTIYKSAFEFISIWKTEVECSISFSIRPGSFQKISICVHYLTGAMLMSSFPLTIKDFSSRIVILSTTMSPIFMKISYIFISCMRSRSPPKLAFAFFYSIDIVTFVPIW